MVSVTPSLLRTKRSSFLKLKTRALNELAQGLRGKEIHSGFPQLVNASNQSSHQGGQSPLLQQCGKDWSAKGALPLILQTRQREGTLPSHGVQD